MHGDNDPDKEQTIARLDRERTAAITWRNRQRQYNVCPECGERTLEYLGHAGNRRLDVCHNRACLRAWC